MMQSGQYPNPPPGSVPAARRVTAGQAVLALLGTAAASAAAGLLAGLLWSVLAPGALLVVQGHGVAYVQSAETSAFIVADGWFCLVTALGGLVCGLAGYFIAVRRYGVLALLGLVLGGVGAAVLAMWAGQQQGRASFRAQLAVSHAGAHLHEPLSLGGLGPLAFWPMFAAIVVGAIELSAQSRERKKAALAQAALPPGPLPPGPLAPGPLPSGPLPPAAGEPGFGDTPPGAFG
jgi:hypothetical protein